MAKEKDRPSTTASTKMLIGIVWSCADMKFLLTSLFFLCSLVTVLQFVPSFRPSPALLDLRQSNCLSTTSAPSSPFPPPPFLTISANATSTSAEREKKYYHRLKLEETVTTAGARVTKRVFNPVGSASYLFVQMGAYRGGSNTFAVIGLASKPIHVFAKPRFLCEWIPRKEGRRTDHSAEQNLTVTGAKILPDWGYGRVYTVVVVNCTFPAAVGADGSGGRLLIHASAGGSYDREVEMSEKIEALVEEPESVDFTVFTAPPRYDYLYCGSSLYGNLSPQRVREWLAYHVRLFGPKSHFVIHDAGGVHRGVMEVLRPWMEKGYVTLQDIREQERFDGYYHNQFLVVNDCLHRYRFTAKWIFFFDVDEFIYISPRNTLPTLLQELSAYTQFTIEQMPMSSKLCLARDFGRTPRMWGIEKLVYRDVKRGVRRDRKYAIQPRAPPPRRGGGGAHVAEHRREEPPRDGAADQVLPLPRHHLGAAGPLPGVPRRLQSHLRRHALRARHGPALRRRVGQKVRAQDHRPGAAADAPVTAVR